MTDDEKREKEIEMGKHLCPKFEIYCSDCGEDCNIADHCSLLIDAGYRKAQEIFTKCKEKCMFQGYPYGIDYQELVEVFKEFGVDVEE